jgi:hypothetical protein
MKRAVAQFLGGRQAEASTTAESMVEPVECGLLLCCSCSPPSVGLVVVQSYSTVLSESDFGSLSGAGQGEGGKDCREALAGARWPG